MIVVRVYAVLDNVVSEVSCIGDRDGHPAHLLYREQATILDKLDFQDVADALGIALLHAARLDLEQGIGWTDDCSWTL